MCSGSTQAPMNDFMLSWFNSFNCRHNTKQKRANVWNCTRQRNTASPEDKTRKPCCCRKLPRDAGHSCRTLAPNPRTSQWIETSLKLSANMAEVVEKPLYKCISEGLIHVVSWYHRTPGQSSRNSRNKCRFQTPTPNTAKCCRTPTKIARYLWNVEQICSKE